MMAMKLVKHCLINNDGIDDDDDDDGKRCSGCRMVAYCDINCQKDHRQEHKDNCRLFIIMMI